MPQVLQVDMVSNARDVGNTLIQVEQGNSCPGSAPQNEDNYETSDEEAKPKPEAIDIVKASLFAMNRLGQKVILF